MHADLGTRQGPGAVSSVTTHVWSLALSATSGAQRTGTPASGLELPPWGEHLGRSYRPQTVPCARPVLSADRAALTAVGDHGARLPSEGPRHMEIHDYSMLPGSVLQCANAFAFALAVAVVMLAPVIVFAGSDRRKDVLEGLRILLRRPDRSQPSPPSPTLF